jgi:hypothetical protein
MKNLHVHNIFCATYMICAAAYAEGCCLRAAEPYEPDRYMVRRYERAPDPAPVELTLAERHELAINIPKLGAEEFEVREAASHQIYALGSRVILALKDAYKAADDAEVRARLDNLVERLNPSKVVWVRIPWTK